MEDVPELTEQNGDILLAQGMSYVDNTLARVSECVTECE